MTGASSDAGSELTYRDIQFWVEWIRVVEVDPESWLDSAAMLKRAADTLAPVMQPELQAATLGRPFGKPSIAPVYLMLAGFAIENVAKGLIVCGRPRSAPPKRHLDAKLVAAAGFNLLEDEPDLVGRLSLFLGSFGRYPVPLPKDAPKLAYTNPITAPTRYSTNDPNLVNKLYDRMFNDLRQRIDAHKS